MLGLLGWLDGAVEVPDPGSDLNAWLFVAAVFVLAGAVGALARYIARLVNQLTSGLLVPRDVVSAEVRLTEALDKVTSALERATTALTEASQREREYMRWLETRNGRPG